jgi:hypothetical protein
VGNRNGENYYKFLIDLAAGQHNLGMRSNKN